jgi:hypothetical protein
MGVTVHPVPEDFKARIGRKELARAGATARLDALPREGGRLVVQRSGLSH